MAMRPEAFEQAVDELEQWVQKLTLREIRVVHKTVQNELLEAIRHSGEPKQLELPFGG